MLRLPAYVCFFAWLVLGLQVSLAQVPYPLCQVYYVDQNATGPVHDGSSWCSAFLSLSDALLVADGCDTVRVADGVYTPSTQGLADPREATFDIVGGLTLEGGYNGCGSIKPDLRDVNLFETLLSGDLNGDDDTTGDNSDNAYTVVTANIVLESTTIDGFSIAHGNADAPIDILSDASSNVPGSGFNGGGIFSRNSVLIVNQCNIYDNHALLRGGGVNIEDSTINFSNTRIHGNASDAEGGGVECIACNLTLIDSEISFNQAIIGGGMDFFIGSLLLERVIIRGNRASELPGADAGAGGGLVLSLASTTINNSLLVDNRAAGGGAVFLSDGHVDVSNSTIVRNFASNSRVGGGISIQSGTLEITNSIVWGNRGGIGTTLITTQIDWAVVSDVAYSHNDIELWNVNIERSLGSIGNFSANPLFMDEDGMDNIPDTSDDDFRLSMASPCINRSDPTIAYSAGTTDLDGNARTQGCRTDIGTYESTKLNIFGDYDGDDQLTLADFAQFQLCFGAVANTSAQATVCTCIFDTNNNDVLDLVDLSDFIEKFGGLSNAFGDKQH